MHAWDWQLSRRSLGLFGLLLFIAAAIVVGTDEPDSTLGLRIARLAALAPALVALSELWALGQSEARGELRALAALGASPWRSARGAVVAGVLMALVTLGALLAPVTDVASLFPVVKQAASWERVASGLREPAFGVTVTAAGEMALSAELAAAATRPAPGREAALACIGPLALFAPLWGAAPIPIRTRLWGAALAVLAAIVLLHAAAAGVVPVLMLATAALPLAAQSAWAWSRRRLA